MPNRNGLDFPAEKSVILQAKDRLRRMRLSSYMVELNCHCEEQSDEATF